MNFLDRIKLAAGRTPSSTKQAEQVKQVVLDLFRQNFGKYQHQLNEWQMARGIRHDIDRPLTYAIQEMYDDAMVDTHLRAIVESRILRVVNQEFVISKADGTTDDDKTKLINKPWFTDMIRLVMESLFFGYNLIYLKEIAEGEIKAVTKIPRDHIIPEKQWIINNVTDTDKGLDFNEFNNFLLYAQLGQDAIGLLEVASPLTILKRHSWGSWDEFEQRFGLPLMIAKIASSGTKQKKEVANWLSNLARGGGGVFGIQDELEVVSNGQTDSYQVFLQKISSVNSELSKLILGQTMTTDNGSSRSQAEVHQGTLNEITRADVREVLHWLNQCLKPVLIAHGYPLTEDDTFDIFNKAQPEERIKIDIPLLQAGYRLSSKYIESTYNVELEEVADEPPPTKPKNKAEAEKLAKVQNFFV